MYKSIFASTTHTPIKVKDFSIIGEGKEWNAYRKMGLGGSDASVLMGDSPYKIMRDLWYDKKGVAPINNSDEDKWLIFEIGHVLEPVIRKLFAKKTGLRVETDAWLYRHPIYAFMQANVDGFCYLPNGERCILEIKTTSGRNSYKWDNDGVPKEYEWQVRHYMAVMNISTAFIICLWGNTAADCAIRRITRDLEMEDELIMMEKFFWETYVDANIIPPFDGLPRLQTTHSHSFAAPPDASKCMAQLNLDFAKMAETVLACDAKIDALNAEIKRLSDLRDTGYAPLIAELKGRPGAVIDMGREKKRAILTAAPKKSRTTVDLKKVKLIYPELYDKLEKFGLLRTGKEGVNYTIK